jgi:hypothetical protein
LKLAIDPKGLPLVAASIAAGAVTWGSNYFQQRALQCESQVTANEYRIVNTNVNLMATYQRSVDRKLAALAGYIRGTPDPELIKDLVEFDRQIRVQAGQFERDLYEHEIRLKKDCDSHNFTSAIYALLSIFITGLATYLGYLAGIKRSQKRRVRAAKKSIAETRPIDA